MGTSELNTGVARLPGSYEEALSGDDKALSSDCKFSAVSQKIRFAVAMCSTYITRVFANKNGTAVGLVISVTYDAKFCRYDLVLEVAIVHPHPTPKKVISKAMTTNTPESNIQSAFLLSNCTLQSTNNT